MPLIKPFRAFRYDPARVDPAGVVAPPYDVIDDRLRRDLSSRHPRNVVRLILGEGNDPYRDAATYLASWFREGVLVSDPRPGVYFLEQEFTLLDGRSFVREGFIAACRLEEFGGSVLPHEKTHSGPKEDRLRLMEATGAMFSQVFALYPDPAASLAGCFRDIRSTPPAWEAVYDGVRNTIRISTDDRINLAVAAFLTDTRVVIADGHHRYETALSYMNSMRLKNPGHNGYEPYNFVPMFFSSMNEPGMIVLPTHRLLRGLQGFDPGAFLSGAGDYFDVSRTVETGEMLELLDATPGTAFGVVTGPPELSAVLKLNGRGTALMEQMPAVVGRLGVTALHRVIFGELLRIPGDSRTLKKYIDYERDEHLSAERVRSGAYQAAFLMKPTPLEHVRLVAEAGHTLPQKSTYFFPKLLSGVVNYAFTEGVVR